MASKSPCSPLFPSHLPSQNLKRFGPTHFLLLQLPESLTIYRSLSVVKNAALRKVEDTWAYSRIEGRTFAAFGPPPESLHLTAKQQVMIGKSDRIFEKRADNVIKEIIRRCLRVKGLEAGLFE